MNAASALVIYGAVAASAEHGSWAMRLAIHERSWSEPHATVHYFMAGAYAAIAGVVLSVIALTLVREGRRVGWLTILFVLLVGGTLELTMNGPPDTCITTSASTATSQPGSPPWSWPASRPSRGR